LKQYHVAETEKFAHVTSFFNCGINDLLPGEERTIVQSPINNKNYEDRPEMSGMEITDKLVEQIKNGKFDFYLANYANADMVGHTGNIRAAIKAVQYLDRFLQQVMTAVLSVDGLLIITADHGNIEIMVDSKTGDIDKEHSTSPIPMIVISKDLAFAEPKERNYLSLSGMIPAGVVSDIAPTVLEFMGIEKPKEMTAVSLTQQIFDQLK
jgi:2,3-bisphosphoglycerate-independent phosphoglycerate mutase